MSIPPARAGWAVIGINLHPPERLDAAAAIRSSRAVKLRHVSSLSACMLAGRDSGFVK
jgi:hypothetical protein